MIGCNLPVEREIILPGGLIVLTYIIKRSSVILCSCLLYSISMNRIVKRFIFNNDIISSVQTFESEPAEQPDLGRNISLDVIVAGSDPVQIIQYHRVEKPCSFSVFIPAHLVLRERQQQIVTSVGLVRR